jgi:hypothetical protein
LRTIIPLCGRLFNPRGRGEGKIGREIQKREKIRSTAVSIYDFTIKRKLLS